ncbi:MAG: NUDIX domain-containing protein [Acutalibacteraceae bacterium]|nr:NUDIX domain-containing protein [Acutalibacteraceae bacterium]
MDVGFINKSGQFRLRACAVIIEDGCVLMAKNDRDDYYYSVGGGVKQNEASTYAVLREVLEEAGLSYEIDRLLCVHENFFTSDNGENGTALPFHEFAMYYLMKPKGFKPEITAESYSSGNIAEHMHWLPIDKYSEYKAYPEFFADMLKNLPDSVQHIITYEK